LVDKTIVEMSKSSVVNGNSTKCVRQFVHERMIGTNKKCIQSCHIFTLVKVLKQQYNEDFWLNLIYIRNFFLFMIHVIMINQ
jgi:hypothetical protein